MRTFELRTPSSFCEYRQFLSTSASCVKEGLAISILLFAHVHRCFLMASCHRTRHTLASRNGPLASENGMFTSPTVSVSVKLSSILWQAAWAEGSPRRKTDVIGEPLARGFGEKMCGRIKEPLRTLHDMLMDSTLAGRLTCHEP